MRTCAAVSYALLDERQGAHVGAGRVGGAADEAAAAARQLDAQRLPARGARARRLCALALLPVTKTLLYGCIHTLWQTSHYYFLLRVHAIASCTGSLTKYNC